MPRTRRILSGKAANPWAEIVKHGFILLVLSSAFFPLYMMLNISTKDNRMEGAYHCYQP